MQENKKYIYLSLYFLLFFIILFQFVVIPEEVKKILIEQAKQTILAHYSNNNFILAWNIFINNSLVGFFALISGFFMSFLSILIMFGNVLIMYIVLPLSIEKYGIFKTLLLLIPHGITEIFAVLISIALSFKITHIIFKKMWNWKENKLIPHLKDIFLFWFIFVLPLFLLSAFIEAFITPLFL